VSTNQIIIVLAVGVVASVIKSITGMGYPLVTLPIIAMVMDVAEAVVLISPANLFLNGKLMWTFREHLNESSTLRPFLSGGIVGAVIGALLLPVVPDRWLRVLLILIIVLFLLNRVSSRTFTMSESQGRRYAPFVGGLAGILQGAAAISGPIVGPWFLSVEQRQEVYIFSISAVFGVTGLSQILVFAISGLFTWTMLAVAGGLIVLAQSIFPIGARVRDRISVEAFEHIVLGLLACGAISLLVDLL